MAIGYRTSSREHQSQIIFRQFNQVCAVQTLFLKGSRKAVEVQLLQMRAHLLRREVLQGLIERV